MKFSTEQLSSFNEQLSSDTVSDVDKQKIVDLLSQYWNKEDNWRDLELTSEWTPMSSFVLFANPDTFEEFASSNIPFKYEVFFIHCLLLRMSADPSQHQKWIDPLQKYISNKIQGNPDVGWGLGQSLGYVVGQALSQKQDTTWICETIEKDVVLKKEKFLEAVMNGYHNPTQNFSTASFFSELMSSRYANISKPKFINYVCALEWTTRHDNVCIPTSNVHHQESLAFLSGLGFGMPQWKEFIQQVKKDFNKTSSNMMGTNQSGYSSVKI